MMNIQGLMKQAQMMQKKMQEEQERLEKEEFEGVSGGGMVKVARYILVTIRSIIFRRVLDCSI